MAEPRNPRRLVSRIAGVLVGIVLIVGFALFVQAMMSSKSGKPDRKVQIVQIIRPPPPPPDQPPPLPPEKTEEQLPKDEPEPAPDEQQAPAQLGLDADGSAGGDAFGLAARRGGSDLIGGTGTAPFAWYTNRVRDAIQERLASAPCTKSAKGALLLRVLLEADGRVKQIKLSTTTGDKKMDDCIETALAPITRMSDPVPPGMPEQINVKVVARI